MVLYIALKDIWHRCLGLAYSPHKVTNSHFFQLKTSHLNSSKVSTIPPVYQKVNSLYDVLQFNNLLYINIY